MEVQKIKLTKENEKAIIESMSKNGWKLQSKEYISNDEDLAVFVKAQDNRTMLNG